MKKTLFMIIVGFALGNLNIGVVLAESEGKDDQGKGGGYGGGQQVQSGESQINIVTPPADANKPLSPGEQIRSKIKEHEHERALWEVRKKQRQRIRQMREKGVDKYKADGNIGGIGRGKDFQRQISVVEKQMTYEQAKHSDRVARLKRIKELALEKNDTATVERVDKLMQKEQQRYIRKRDYLREKARENLRLSIANLREKGVRTGGEKIPASEKGQSADEQKTQGADVNNTP